MLCFTNSAFESKKSCVTLWQVKYLVLLTDAALPFFLWNLGQRRLKTSQVVDSRTRITTQQVTEPTTSIQVDVEEDQHPLTGQDAAKVR